MSMDGSDSKLDDLIQGYIDGSLTAEESGELTQILADDPEVITRLLHGLREDAWIQETVHRLETQFQAPPSHAMNWDDDALETEVDMPVNLEEVAHIKALADRKLQAYLAEQEKNRPRNYSQAKQIRRFALDLPALGRAIDKGIQYAFRGAAALAFAFALTILVLIPVQYLLAHRTIAFVDESVHSQWDVAPKTKTLHSGPLMLIKGFARLRFTSGAEVLLTAPCTVDLKSPKKILLTSGTLTAKVSEPAHGFQVETPFTMVKDLGTEFGVSTTLEDNTEVHVFDGHVKMKATRSSNPNHWIDILEGQGAKTGVTAEIDLIEKSDMARAFARSIPQEGQSNGIPGVRLDLADVVAGGNGFGTGGDNYGIDPVAGTQVTTESYKKRTGNNRYATVKPLPFVDGVFVPQVSGLTQISSASHLYQFPATQGLWEMEIGRFEMPCRTMQNGILTPRPIVLDGQTYGTKSNPAIYCHPNSGITFDLKAIRDRLLGTRIASFSSIFGISSNVDPRYNPDAEAHVLVDGQLRFHAEVELTGRSFAKIRVALQDTDRFLTLACTEGSPTTSDWTSFAMPTLELAAK